MSVVVKSAFWILILKLQVVNLKIESVDFFAYTSYVCSVVCILKILNFETILAYFSKLQLLKSFRQDSAQLYQNWKLQLQKLQAVTWKVPTFNFWKLMGSKYQKYIMPIYEGELQYIFVGLRSALPNQVWQKYTVLHNKKVHNKEVQSSRYLYKEQGELVQIRSINAWGAVLMRSCNVKEVVQSYAVWYSWDKETTRNHMKLLLYLINKIY